MEVLQKPKSLPSHTIYVIKKNKCMSDYHGDPCTSLFTIARFGISQGNQCGYTIEFYSVIKKNEMKHLQETKIGDHGSDKSQSPKGKHHMFCLLCGTCGVGHETKRMSSVKAWGIIRK